MTPGILDLTLYRGATFGPITIQCLTAPIDEGGVVVSLVGYSAEAQVRKAVNGPLVLDLAPTIPTPSDGKARIYWTDEQTKAIKVHGDYLYDFFLINPSGERIGPFLAGAFKIKTSITKE